MQSLEPEIEKLKDKMKYLSEVNEKVQQAQKVTEGFVQEVVSVNELLAKSLKDKKRQIRHLSRDRRMRKSESCSFLENFNHNKLSEAQNIAPNNLLSHQKKVDNSQDTSCDSKQSDLKKRNSRFFHDRNFSFKQRANSTHISNFNAFGVENDSKGIELTNKKNSIKKQTNSEKPNMYRSVNINKSRNSIMDKKSSIGNYYLNNFLF